MKILINKNPLSLIILSLTCYLFSGNSFSDFIYSTETVKGSEFDVSYHLIETDDGLYVPIGLRTPNDDGPFPVILFTSGNGNGGLDFVKDYTQNRSWTQEKFLQNGYAVAWLRYRAEVDAPKYTGSSRVGRDWSGRQRFDRALLEYEDVVSIINYVKELSDIDSNKIGYMGMSHGGEMLMKIASEYPNLLTVAIASEPASMDFLAVSPPAPDQDYIDPSVPDTYEANTLEMQEIATDKLINERVNLEIAMKRIASISMPILIQVRDRDHNQDTFLANYKLLKQAEKNVEWQSYDHEFHGFAYPERNQDGEYKPDEIQTQVEIYSGWKTVMKNL